MGEEGCSETSTFDLSGAPDLMPGQGDRGEEKGRGECELHWDSTTGQTQSVHSPATGWCASVRGRGEGW